MSLASLKSLSYYQTGGSCDKLCLPSSYQHAAELWNEVKSLNTPYFILGGGSNSLVWDDHYSGAVFNFSKLNQLEIKGNRLFCGAGAINTDIAEAAYAKSLGGAAWMNRLPGQIGGTTRMNARCYGGEISEIVSKVHCVNKEGQLIERCGSELFRGYKDTVFMTNQDMIVGVELDLQAESDPAELRKKMDYCESDRIAKDQFIYPSCGCVFKNDYEIGLPSGMLLEHAGVKGLSCGGAVVSSKHSNFIFNQSASSRDILRLSFSMQDTVWEKYGVWLQYEMEVLGDLPKDLDLRLHKERRHQPKEKLLAPLRDQFKNKS